MMTGCQHYEQNLPENQEGRSTVSAHSEGYKIFQLPKFKLLLWDDSQKALSYSREFDLSPKDKAITELLLVEHSLSHKPAVKLLEQLVAIDISLLEMSQQHSYAALLDQLVTQISPATLKSYRTLAQQIEPWVCLKKIVDDLNVTSYQAFFRNVERWRHKYPNHEAYSLVVGDLKDVIENGFADINKIGLLIHPSEKVQWFDQFIRQLENHSSRYSLVYLQEDRLETAYQKFKERSTDIVLTIGFKDQSFKAIGKYHLPVATVSLSENFDHCIDNLWVFPPKDENDKKEIKQILSHDKSVFFLQESDSHTKLAVEHENSLMITREDYQEKILKVLEIPDRKKYFEKKIAASIDYFALPSKNYSTVVLDTTSELARLSYPYWKLKSPIKTKFVGLTSLLENNANLDRTLKGMILPTRDKNYDAEMIYQFIDNIPRFFLDKTFTLSRSGVILKRSGNTFVQQDSFREYQG